MAQQGRGLIGGIADHDLILTQLKNGDQEYVVLRRHPFHEAPTRAAMFQQYALAVRFMFEYVPEDQWLPVMGRFSRKLVKRNHYFEQQEQGKPDGR